MKVSLAIPYRGTHPSRTIALQRVQPNLERMYEWDDICLVDADPGEEFNRAATRNKAMKIFKDSDVVVICDADSIPEEDPLNEVIAQAAVSGLVHFPFDQVRLLTRDASHHVNRKPLRVLQYSKQYGPSQGGIFVASPLAWWAAGGMDERLSGWGYEDRQFLICTETLMGGAVIHPGMLYCLWHARYTTHWNVDNGDSEIYSQYDSLWGNQEGLMEYIEKRGRYDQSVNT